MLFGVCTFGICTYADSVGSLWYDEAVRRRAFPLTVGQSSESELVSSSLPPITSRSPSHHMTVSKFIAIRNTVHPGCGIHRMQYAACDSQPSNVSRAGVPISVYITYIIVMLVAAALALFALCRIIDITCGIDAAISEWNEKH